MGPFLLANATDVDTLGRVVSRLIEIERLSGWSRTNAIGELILNGFFRGDVQAWRSRARDKCGSLRRLAAHPDCPLRKSALSDAVNCYLFLRDNPQISTLNYVTPGHVTIALRAGETKALGFLEEADGGQWSVRQLASQVRLDQSTGGVAREALSALRRVERRFLRATSAIGKLRVCEPFEANQLAESLRQVRERLLSLRQLIAPIGPCLSDGDRPRSEITGLSLVELRERTA
jgi:hypothetical protein